MFCFQCQETARGTGCTVRGVCGKEEHTANLQDLLIFHCKGIAVLAKKGKELGTDRVEEAGRMITHALFTTITNANFDDTALIECIKAAQSFKDDLKSSLGDKVEGLHDSALYSSSDESQFQEKAKTVGILSTENEDVRSLREIVVFGCKGISAYAHHAAMLGFEKKEVYEQLIQSLASVTEDLSVDEMVAMVMKTGENAVATMAVLDEANTSTYGHPEISKVNLGVGSQPGILVSGHDLRDLQELLIQTEGRGVDVYTHSEMLPAHYYPELKKYAHLKGNYGSSWWHQNKDFETFNGAVLMTTNCVIPIKKNNTYADRIFTTGAAGYPGAVHIADRKNGAAKDFSNLIAKAKQCPPPEEIETGEIVGGFAHNQVLALADKVIEAVKSGAIKRFVVMAGCDGRMKNRSYFTEVAQKLPKDTVILTAGCAKYRYNKLDLGDIGGIPRVLDAGQCNDSYSLAVIAMKLRDAFGLEHINDLPLSFDIGWYEQKAVAVLLALLALGIKGIRLGPTLPAFVSPTVLNVLVEKFDIKPIGDVDEDIAAMMAGK
ncbi:hydroxylamine reductase [Desulfospira joergensenii]|uniref:hydroxylamine reductase n=1 Tax=Desulfospira joergensenii TaxID=53329 RepID=UPI0003B76334|nr:hydroxylamine reductase [Desulfospira joergensenii]